MHTRQEPVVVGSLGMVEEYTLHSTVIRDE